MTLDDVSVPERPGEIRACLRVRNEALRLPSVFDHHRALGADRFLVIDDGSTDGTLDYLTAQPDTHVLHGDGGYAANRGGLRWVHAALDAFCDGHWSLTLDADELFIFPGFERVGLPALCAHLDRSEVRGVFALLLDMYGDGDVSEAIHAPGAPLLETCGWFDPGPYTGVRAGPYPHVQLQGGVRARVFDFSPYQPRPPVISKVPLVKWRRGMKYLLSTHAVTSIPIYPMLAALLHFKFLRDFPARVATAVAEGPHYGRSQEYRAYQDRLRANGGRLRLHDAHSVRFTGGDQLVTLDLMQTDAAYEAFLASASGGEDRPAIHNGA